MKGLASRYRAATVAVPVLMLVAAGASVMAQAPVPGRPPPRPAAPPPAPVAPAPSAQFPAAPAAPVAPLPAAQAPAAQAPAAPQAEAAPAAPVPTRTETLYFENWVVRCDEFAEGARARVCSALLQLLQQNTKQLVFAWNVTADNKQFVTTIQTPTGVAIPPGVELRIGKSAPHKIPYASCFTDGCIAKGTMDGNLLREMTLSPTAEAVIQGGQGNAVTFPIQMKGFDRAYAILARP